MKWLLALLLASPAMGQRAIMEQVPSSRYAIKVDTQNGRVDIATTSYNWGVANVGLHVASNVVVDTLAVHNGCVIYATGSITCLGQVLGGVGPAGPTGPSGQSNLAVATGTSAGFGSVVSSPTAVINFDYPTFTAQLKGSATAYISINAVPTSAVDLSTITTVFQGVGASTQAIASGGATTYLRVNGSNFMTGQFITTSTATVQGNAFSVGGSTFNVKGGLVGIGTPASGAALSILGSSSLGQVNIYDGSGGFSTAIGNETTAGQIIVGSAVGDYSQAAAGPMNWSANSGSNIHMRLTASGALTIASTSTVRGNAFSVGGSSFVVTAGSVSIPYQLVAGSLNMSGSSSTITTASSVTASAFFGSGSGLTGTAASLTAGNVTTNANLTGPVTSVGNATTIAGPVPQAAVNLSTVTTWLQTLLSSGAVPTNFVNLSTVTTALTTKASSGTNTDLTSLGAVTSIGSAVTTTTFLGAVNTNLSYQIQGVNAISQSGTGTSYGAGTLHVGVTGNGDTGPNNTFVGVNAGNVNSSGGQNSYIGTAAGQANTTGTFNTAVGNSAMAIASTATLNVAVGYQAGYNNSAGQNTMVGVNAGTQDSGGNNNTEIGYQAGNSNVQGSQNTIVGASAGGAATNLSGNVFIGYAAGNNENNATGNVLIGYQVGSATNTNNALYIDNSATNSPLIQGDFSSRSITFNASAGMTDTGQAIVVGTATVRGNAFSVGSSSFVVSGGSATVAYNATAGSFTSPIGSISKPVFNAGAAGGLYFRGNAAYPSITDGTNEIYVANGNTFLADAGGGALGVTQGRVAIGSTYPISWNSGGAGDGSQVFDTTIFRSTLGGNAGGIVGVGNSTNSLTANGSIAVSSVLASGYVSASSVYVGVAPTISTFTTTGSLTFDPKATMTVSTMTVSTAAYVGTQAVANSVLISTKIFNPAANAPMLQIIGTTNGTAVAGTQPQLLIAGDHVVPKMVIYGASSAPQLSFIKSSGTFAAAATSIYNDTDLNITGGCYRQSDDSIRSCGTLSLRNGLAAGGNGGSVEESYWVMKTAQPGSAGDTNALILTSSAGLSIGINVTTTSSSNNRLDLVSAGTGGLAIGAGYAQTVTSPADGAIIKGNVGIGTTGPQYPLDVAGAAQIQGQIVAGGSVTITATSPAQTLGVVAGITVNTGNGGTGASFFGITGGVLSSPNSGVYVGVSGSTLSALGFGYNNSTGRGQIAATNDNAGTGIDIYTRTAKAGLADNSSLIATFQPTVVGISTGTPQYTLDDNGSFYAHGQIIAGASVTVVGNFAAPTVTSSMTLTQTASGIALSAVASVNVNTGNGSTPSTFGNTIGILSSPNPGLYVGVSGSSQAAMGFGFNNSTNRGQISATNDNPGTGIDIYARTSLAGVTNNAIQIAAFNGDGSVALGNAQSTFTVKGSLYMAAGSTIASGGGVLTLSTDTYGAANPTHAIQMDNNGFLKINGGGLDVVTISTFLTANINSTIPLAVAFTPGGSLATRTDGAFWLDNGGGAVRWGRFGHSLSDATLSLYTASGTVSMLQPWSNPPANGTELGSFGMYYSTGLNRQVAGAITANVESGAVASPGVVALIPTQLRFNNSNQSGANTIQMVLTSTGSLLLGASSVAGDASSVKLHVITSSATIDGQLNIGWEQITNACGAGVTTCTATCSANKVLLGGGCTSLVSLTGDSSGGSTNSWTCTSALSTITAYVTCARFGP